MEAGAGSRRFAEAFWTLLAKRRGLGNAMSWATWEGRAENRGGDETDFICRPGNLPMITPTARTRRFALEGTRTRSDARDRDEARLSGPEAAVPGRGGAGGHVGQRRPPGRRRRPSGP